MAVVSSLWPSDAVLAVTENPELAKIVESHQANLCLRVFRHDKF